MINIEDIRNRCECSIANTAVGSHLDAALTELEMVRRRSQLLIRRMEGCRLDMDPRVRHFWQQLDAATKLEIKDGHRRIDTSSFMPSATKGDSN